LPDEEKKILLAAIQELRRALPRAWELGVVRTNATGSRLYLANKRREYQADIIVPRLFTGMCASTLRRAGRDRDAFPRVVSELAAAISGMLSDFAWPDDVREDLPFLARARAAKRLIIEA
jgi:hypothetical protein